MTTIGKSNEVMKHLIQDLDEPDFPDWAEDITGPDSEIECATEEIESDGQEAADDLAPAQVLLRLVEDLDNFLDQRNRPCVTFTMRGLDCTAPIASGVFRDYMRTLYRRETADILPQGVITTVVSQLEAETRCCGQHRNTYMRTAFHQEHVYVDLYNEGGQVVDIGPDGWEVTATPPVRFIRGSTMRPQVMPDDDGDLDALLGLINVSPGSDDQVLATAWLLKGFFPDSTMPVAVLEGPEGSGKSTAVSVLRRLIDPADPAHVSPPRGERNLIVHANDSAVLAFDNCGRFRRGYSDCLCRLSSGSGYGRRRNYSDTGQFIFSGRRPIVMCGIAMEPEQHDLLDRALLIRLNPIPDSYRLLERQLEEHYRDLAPRILGGLYDAISIALRRWDQVDTPALPRLADFARLVTAAEPALPWDEGHFLEVLGRNSTHARAEALGNDVLARAVAELLASQGDIEETTAADLLPRLREAADSRQGMPASPAALGRKLREIEGALRQAGISLTFAHTNRGRLVRITDYREEPGS